MRPMETLNHSNSVISSGAESPVYGQFREVEKPAFLSLIPKQSFPGYVGLIQS